MRLLFAIAVIAILAGCADKNAKSWIGQPIGNVMAQNGAPELESRTGDAAGC